MVEVLPSKMTDRHRYGPAISIVIVACSLFLLLSISPTTNPVYAASNIITIQEAVLVAKNETKHVLLPYELEPNNFAPDGDIVHFNSEFNLDEVPASSTSIFIERLSLSGKIYINNKEIGSCGLEELRNLRCRHQPLLLTIPASFLNKGVNSIEIELYTNSHQRDGLSKIIIGPTEYLNSAFYRPKYFWSHEFILATTWTALSVGSIFLIIGLIRRSEPLYLWFGLASILNALSSINLLANHIWFDDWWTTWFIFSVRLSSAPVTFLSILIFFRQDFPRTKYFLILYALAGPILIGLSDNSRQLVLSLYAPLLLITFALLAATTYWTYKSRTFHEFAITLMLYFVALTSMRDYYMMMGHSSFTNYYYASHSLAGMFFVMSALIIKIVVDASNTSQQINRALQTQVSLFEESLVEKQKKLLELENNVARTHERELLLREMHDGLGSNLALAKVQVSKGEFNQEQTKALFDDCIDDLRLILDSTDTEEDFAYAIAKIRSRFNPRLQTCGMKQNWQVHLLDMPDISPQIRLNIMRIIQEGLTNVMRHSHATELTISIDYINDELLLEIKDNGSGFGASDKNSHGRGLGNMRHRAKLIGAEFDMKSSNNGTILSLKKPLSRSAGDYS